MSAHIPPHLSALGWDPWFEQRFAPFAEAGWSPARVVADHGIEFIVQGESRTSRAQGSREAAVGDWVAIEWAEPVAFIRGVVERRSLVRRRTGYASTRSDSEVQALAANVDVVFLVATAVDVNVRRLERYLTIAWQSGASPAIVITKTDLAADLDTVIAEAEAVAAAAPVIVTSAVDGVGLEELAAQLRPARTGVLIGPSGAGKSSLTNALLGAQLMKTREVHESGEGRHMTSHRQLLSIPGGGMLIDTPGLREAQLWAGEEALDDVFSDIDELSARCRFGDCAHVSEPGCAVTAAIASGELDAARLQSYRKLQRELRAIAARSDARLRAEERRKWKLISQAAKSRTRP